MMDQMQTLEKVTLLVQWDEDVLKLILVCFFSFREAA